MLTTFANRPTWAEINLNNLAFNFHSIKKFIGENIEFMAIVKADAYGHNAVRCAKRLETEGVNWLGVAMLEEGIELRNNGIKTHILCLGSFWKGQEKSLIANDISPMVYQLEMASALNQISREVNSITKVHIKIDTGMGRLGVRFDEVDKFAEKFRAFKNLKADGIMTHFATADNLSENEFTFEQINKFNQAVDIFESKGFRFTYKDLANSPGAIAHENSRSNLVRIGGILYGLGDDVLPQQISKPQLKPVMSLHTRIAHLKWISEGETLGYGRTFTTKRKSLIATIPIGYEDGYRRALSNKGRVLVKKQLAPVVGRISMDWTIVDVTDITDIKVNDEVLLIGEMGELKVSAEDVAEQTDTISYEITCGINRRVERKYVGS